MLKTMFTNDLPLQRFVGDSICRIETGFRDVEFHFHRAGRIALKGAHWQIRDTFGVIVDESIQSLPSAPQRGRAHVLLNSKMVSFDIDAKKSFSLLFFNGHKLTIYNDEAQDQAFLIEPVRN